MMNMNIGPLLKNRKGYHNLKPEKLKTGEIEKGSIVWHNSIAAVVTMIILITVVIEVTIVTVVTFQ